MSSLTVVPIETPTLGDRSYLVHDGEVAFVVDPQRDIDRVLAAAVAAVVGARVAYRVDTRRLSAAFTGLVLAVAAYTAVQALPALTT